jgi:hypothetical protein
MSIPLPPQPAKLVIGLIFHNRSKLAEVSRILQHQFGQMDMISPWFPFNFTDYYYNEMGAPLYRRMLVFQELVLQGDLASIKLRTNEVEARIAHQGQRQVNIDPGILSHERFVLATGKNYSHRIYIGHNIYADLTLLFQKGGYQVLPWTYPDYASEVMRDFLFRVRQKYADDLLRFRQTPSSHSLK